MTSLPAILETISVAMNAAACSSLSAESTVGFATEPAPVVLSKLTLLIPVLPLLASVLCGACAALRVKSKLPAWLTVASLAASFVLTFIMYRELTGGVTPTHAKAAVVHGYDWIRFIWGGTGTDKSRFTHEFIANFSLYIDPLTCVWMLFVTGLATLIALYASEYMSHDIGTGYNRFFAAFALFVFSMACLVMADNLVLLYLGWEGVGLCSYLLIGYFYKKPSAVAAAKKAFIVNRVGDLFLALGIFLTFIHFGSVEYSVIFEKAGAYIAPLRQAASAQTIGQAAQHLSEIPMIVQIIPLLFIGGAFGKSAQLPLYVWLPDAMEGPTPVSALIHAATMVTAGVYLVARTYPLFLLSEYALPIVAWTGALTALLAATIGMAQFDIKRIMAYSTVSQLGYMFAGLGVLTSIGGVSHVVTHAFFKAMLFLSCGAVMHGFAGQLDLRKLSGVMKMPGWRIVGVAMLIGCLNLAGFPFTAGFFSKDMILAEAFVTPGMSIVGWILLITAGLTAYYTFRVFFRVFVGPQHVEPGDELHDASGHEHDAHGHETNVPEHKQEKTHAHFHPHPPGWAINTVLSLLAVMSIAAVGLFFVGGHDGAVGGLTQASSAAFTSPLSHHDGKSGDHSGAAVTPRFLMHLPAGDVPASELTKPLEALHAGSFLGRDPHEVMYYVSGVVGAIGILIAFYLHLQGRTTAATSRADALVPKLGRVVSWARQKWLVDEFYDFLIVKPLFALSHVFRLIDQFIVDGLVDLAGALPKFGGRSIRPSQSGELHGYAVGMAGGIAVLLAIVLLVVLRGGNG